MKARQKERKHKTFISSFICLCLSTFLFIHPSVYPSVCLFIRPTVRPSNCLYVGLLSVSLFLHQKFKYGSSFVRLTVRPMSIRPSDVL